MPTISKKNQELLDKALKGGLKIEPLIKKYGTLFIVKLLKDMQGEKGTSIHLPYNKKQK